MNKDLLSFFNPSIINVSEKLMNQLCCIPVGLQSYEYFVPQKPMNFMSENLSIVGQKSMLVDLFLISMGKKKSRGTIFALKVVCAG